MNLIYLLLLLSSIHCIIILCKIIQIQHDYTFLQKWNKTVNKNATKIELYKSGKDVIEPYNIFHTAFILM